MKRNIKTIIALSLVACMSIGGAVLTYAEVTEPVIKDGEENDVTVNEDVNTDANVAVQASGGADTTVNGNVENKGDFGVKAEDEGCMR